MRSESYRLITVIVALLGAIPGCVSNRIIKKKVTLPSPDQTTTEYLYETPPITVWIHGTRFIRRPLFQGFFKGIPSLKLAKDLPNDYYLHHVSRSLYEAAPEQFPLETFYLFGWSGKLNAGEREEAAKILYGELHRIINEYKAIYHTSPHIRVITHSHGGNIALNLAKFKQPDENLSIDELILLACPVQVNTKHYIEDQIFQKTYSLYSSLDIAQIIAPQLVHKIHHTKRGRIRSELHLPPLSKRRFNTHPRLAQVKIKLNGRALFHSEFSAPHFMRLLPHILHVINRWDAEQEQLNKNTGLLCVYTNMEFKPAAPRLLV